MQNKRFSFWCPISKVLNCILLNFILCVLYWWVLLEDVDNGVDRDEVLGGGCGDVYLPPDSWTAVPRLATSLLIVL